MLLELAAERSAIAKANEEANAMLRRLQVTTLFLHLNLGSQSVTFRRSCIRMQEVLHEITALSQPNQGLRWLMTVRSREKEAYLQQHVEVTREISRHIRQLQAGGARQQQRDELPSTGRGLPPAPEDDAGWLARNDPFSERRASDADADAASRLLSGGASLWELERVLQDSRRVCVATREAERAFVEAKLSTAQSAAELDAARRLVREGLVASPCWTDAAQEGELREQVERMERDEERLLCVELDAALTEAQKLQSMHILRGRYELQVLAQALQLQRWAFLLRTLLEHSARHTIVGTVFNAERARLEVLCSSVQSVKSMLGGILSTTNNRCDAYAAAAAAPREQRPPQRRADDDRGDGAIVETYVALLAHQLLGVETATSDSSALAKGTSLCSLAGSVASRLVEQQQQGQQALAKVSDVLCSKLPELTSRSAAALEESRALLFPRPSLEGALQKPVRASEGPPPIPVIQLRPSELVAKLSELQTEAFAMSDSLNNTTSETDRFVAHFSEHKEALAAERSVLEWFYLRPEMLMEYISEAEQRLAAIGI